LFWLDAVLESWAVMEFEGSRHRPNEIMPDSSKTHYLFEAGKGFRWYHDGR